MNRDDIYSKNIDNIAERVNHRLSKFTNVPTKDISGICYICYEKSDIKETWCPERDWNQLMLIVDEIEKIDGIEITIKSSSCQISKKDKVTSNFSVICESSTPSRLESVYRCCVDFVSNVAIR